MTLIESAKQIIEDALEEKERPVVMFSGGKDSVVMAYLMRFVFRRPCDFLFHREPWFAEKYAFAEQIIRQWRMTAYDYVPSRVSLWMGRGIVAFTNYYQTAPQGCLALPKNIIEPSIGDRYLCGLVDVLQRPCGTFNYPWDVCFIGHKSSDQDQIAGKVPLHASIVENDQGPRLAFPLRDWTDDDIWHFTVEHNLPVQGDRYNLLQRKELDDKSKNSDYFPVCIRCLDRRITDEMVHCPRLNQPVRNISAQAPYEQIELEYFGEK